MQLPGGIEGPGGVRRGFTFAPITGAVEMVLAAADEGRSLPLRVTDALTAGLAELGGEPVTWERAHHLCVGDRQFLMRQLAARLGMDRLWLTAHCRHCASPFDFAVEQSRLPVKPAGAGYPHAEVETTWGPRHFRLPTGADQAAIAHLDDEDQARLALLSRLAEISVEALTEAEVDEVEKALEAVAPEVALEAEASCPECGTDNRVTLDPYFGIGLDEERLLDEVHRLAATYHWSEQAILALPRSRRQRYLTRIDRDRGMSQ